MNSDVKKKNYVIFVATLSMLCFFSLSSFLWLEESVLYYKIIDNVILFMIISVFGVK